MIRDIRLQSFRSYNDESFEFSSGVNIIVGPNGSGKTNLLEAILVMARGKSYRGRDGELVRFQTPQSRLEAHLTDNTNRIVMIERLDDATRKQFKIDDQLLLRLGFNKQLPVVVFEPNHLRLLHGAPEPRRQYLDDLLEQTQAGYGTLRRQYKRALTQRNALLKKGSAPVRDQLFVWDVRLSELGEQIVHGRQQLLLGLNEQIGSLYGELAHTSVAVQLGYQSTINLGQYGSTLLHTLETSVPQDLVRGFTTHGPHREDFTVLLNNHPFQETASRGETRTLVLALKILETNLLEQTRGSHPILLLDDVFSELDGARRHALTNLLKPHQTFITTTDADVVIQHFTETTHIIPLEC